MTREVSVAWRKPGHAMWQCPGECCDLNILTPGGRPSDHICPYNLIKRKDMPHEPQMHAGESLLEKTWNEADRTFRLLQETPDIMDSRRENLKGRLRGLCWSISLFMNVHFPTEDDVAREIIKRSANDADYVTPGTGVLRNHLPAELRKETVKPVKKANPGNLTNDQVAMIQGKPNFPEDILAAACNTNTSIIRAVRALPVA